MSPSETSLFARAVLFCVTLPLASAAGCGGADGATPHVDHVKLPSHKEWRVVSVRPYEGLEEVELVKVDFPTAEDPRTAFALTKEQLKEGDPICLDHIAEIDTLWAHPVPKGGCSPGAPAGSR